MSLRHIILAVAFIASTTNVNAQSIFGLSCQETGEYLSNIQEYPSATGQTQEYFCQNNCYANNAMTSNPAYGGSPSQNQWFASTTAICTAALYLGIPVGTTFTLTRQPLLSSYTAGPTETYYPTNSASYTYTPLSLYNLNGVYSSFGLACSGTHYPANPTTPAPSSVRGDPQFVGFHGQDFQVHGVDNYVYNIVSTPELQFNTRFIYMGKGRTTLKPLSHLPALSTKAWSHEGNYMGEVGIQVGLTDKIYLMPGTWQHGWKTIQLRNTDMTVSDKHYPLSNDGSYMWVKSTHEVVIHTKQFDLTLVNADGFYNIEAKMNVGVEAIDANTVDGLLGHTAHTRTAKRFPVHDLDDYGIMHEQNDLWSNEFMMNKFQVKQDALAQK